MTRGRGWGRDEWTLDDEAGRSGTGIAPGKRTLASRLGAPGTTRGRAAPGKRSLTEMLPPVRRADTGKPLPTPLRRDLERAAGRDLDAVRVHDDAEAGDNAHAMSAHAFALGRDVYFAQGAYAPDSQAGQRLIAHEVMHTQQHTPMSAPMAKHAIAQPSSDIETQADAFADAFISGRVAEARGIAARPATPPAGIIARSPRAASGPAPAPAPAPVVRLRRGNEPPGGKRYVRRSVPAQALTMQGLITHVLVHAYRWPPEHARGPFDADWIAWDPPDAPGITHADLQRAAGVVTIALSEKLDEYLTAQAARMRGAGANERKRTLDSGLATRSRTEPGQGAQGGQALGESNRPDTGSEASSAAAVQIPERLADLLRGVPGPSMAAHRASWRTIIAELMALSDEDLVYLRMLATHLTDKPERFLDAIRLYKQLKAEYLATLEQALQDAASETGELAPAPERADSADAAAPDPARFKRWTGEQKRTEARRRIEKASREQIAQMVASPGQTAKHIAKSALRPDEAVADVSRSLRDVSKADGGWSLAARSASVGSKYSGVVAGMLAFFAVAAIFTPGLNAMFLMQASFGFAMGSAALALVESELHVRAAGETDSVEAFEAEVRLGAEAQTRGMIAIAGMGAALAGALIARIPLPGRLQSIGNVLSVARTAVASNVGKAWLRIRATTIAKLRESTSGLLGLLDREARALARASADLDGMTAEQFYQRIARDDQLRDAIGLGKDVADSLAELATTGHGRETARRVFDELRSSLREAPKLAREQLQAVIERVERAIADMEAATTPAEFAASLSRAQSELSEPSLASQMASKGAQQTANTLESLVKQNAAESRSNGIRRESAVESTSLNRQEETAAAGIDPSVVKHKQDVPEHYRDDPRFDDLARDPAQGNVPDPLGKSTREAMAALEAEARGVLEPPIRRGTAEVDFFDGNGVPWDVKTPVSPQAGQRWSFERSKPWKSILDQLRKEQPNGNTGAMEPVRVLLDSTYLKKADHVRLWEMLRQQAKTDELARIVEINARF